MKNRIFTAILAITVLVSAYTKGFSQQDDKKKGGTTFFGIETEANQVIYVIDVSGSMMAPAAEPDEISTHSKDKEKIAERGAIDKKAPDNVKNLMKEFDSMVVKMRIDALKKELARAIYMLDENISFTIIPFNSTVKEWPQKLVKASWDNKLKALQFIKETKPSGATALFSGLELGFKNAKQFEKSRPPEEKGKVTEIKPEELTAVYLLSDGMPNIGKFFGKMPSAGPPNWKEDALKWVKENYNKLKLVVHTIAIGDNPGNSADYSDLLKQIAEKGGGIFKLVELLDKYKK